MNCNYCGSRVFYDEKCCSQCGAPIYQSNGIVENARQYKNIAILPANIYFDKNKECEERFSVLGITTGSYGNPDIAKSCDYKILGKNHGVSMRENVVMYKPTNNPFPCSVVIVASHKDNASLNDYSVIEID